MKKCWSEGELRACLDGELPEPDMEAVRHHLDECPECARLSKGLTERAERVALLMSSLAAGAQVSGPVPTVLEIRRRRHMPSWRWTGVPAALAAAITLAFVLAPSRTPPPPARAPEVSSRATTSAPAPDLSVKPPVHPVPNVAAQPRRTATPTARTRTNSEYYLALDDEPIETGVVMRVALDGSDLQADVIYDSQGRPRAIRPVR